MLHEFIDAMTACNLNRQTTTTPQERGAVIEGDERRKFMVQTNDTDDDNDDGDEDDDNYSQTPIFHPPFVCLLTDKNHFE